MIVYYIFLCRDLSQHIRDQIKIAFSKGEAQNRVDQEQCNRYLNSLKRLSANQYANLYPRNSTSTASGLTHDQCNLALTPELQEHFEEEDQSYLRKLMKKVKRANKDDVQSSDKV